MRGTTDSKLHGAPSMCRDTSLTISVRLTQPRVQIPPLPERNFPESCDLFLHVRVAGVLRRAVQGPPRGIGPPHNIFANQCPISPSVDGHNILSSDPRYCP